MPAHPFGSPASEIAARLGADAHGKEALNFQISMLIYNVVAAVFCLILVGFVFLAILWVLNAVFVIIASIQASDGKFYRYPMTIRFIQ